MPQRCSKKLILIDKNRYTGLSRQFTRSKKRARSDISSSESISSSEDADDIDDVMNDDGDNQNKEEANDSSQNIVPEIPDHQDVTEDWLNMLDIPRTWTDQFGQKQSADQDVLPDMYLPENQSRLDFDGVAHQAQDQVIALVSPDSTIPANASAWAGIQYDTDFNIPDIQNQPLVESISGLQGGIILGEVLGDSLGNAAGSSERGKEISNSDSRTVDTVGRVSLVIEDCHRDTLHKLLDLTRKLKGKSKIEINSE